jgi:hypothetical protein
MLKAYLCTLVRWATGLRQHRVGCQAAPTACPLPHISLAIYSSPAVYSLPTATKLASCHRACQRYIASQLSHSSLMVCRSPTATARQRYIASQPSHSSLVVCRSPTATACQLPQSLSAATELASRHRACLRWATGTNTRSDAKPTKHHTAKQLATCHTVSQ